MPTSSWRKGDPRTHQGSGYRAEGDSPLTPWELVQIRNSRVFTGKAEDLQFYVIVLLAVKLFLRSDEFLNLNESSIVWDVSSVNEDESYDGLDLQFKENQIQFQ